MIPATSPQELLDAANGMASQGKEGLLLSGGCDPLGRVPLDGHLEVIRRIKADTALKVNAHCGLVGPGAAERLGRSGVDVVSLDIHQDEAVIHRRLHLPVGAEAYRRTIRSLLDHDLKVVPHIIVGLSREDEERSLDLVLEHPVAGLVVLVLIDEVVVEDQRVLGIVERATGSGMKVALGCMRPRGNWGLERDCILAGVRDLAVPSRRTVDWARENGYRIIERDDCCCLGIDGSL